MAAAKKGKATFNTMPVKGTPAKALGTAKKVPSGVPAKAVPRAKSKAVPKGSTGVKTGNRSGGKSKG
jgi:hypothetical protein